MRHEKIIQREGFKIKIAVSCYMYGLNMDYSIDTVQFLPKGKRKWTHVYCFDNDYKYRRLGINARKDYEIIKYLEHVTKEEINEALIELCNKVKPNLL